MGGEQIFTCMLFSPQEAHGGGCIMKCLGEIVGITTGTSDTIQLLHVLLCCYTVFMHLFRGYAGGAKVPYS